MGVVEQKEAWHNPNACEVWVEVDNPYTPNFPMSKLIGPGETILISPRERRQNQQAVVGKGNDVFTNGTLSPAQLIEDEADYASLISEPNVKSESDLKAMFSETAAQFKKSLAAIDNRRVIIRIQEIATDDPTKVSLAQSKAIQARLDEFPPEVERDLGDGTRPFTEIKPIEL